MIEVVDNIIQLSMTVITTVVAAYHAVRLKSRAWSMLGLFSGVYSLGLIYWLLFLLFFGHTPEYSSIPDLCWYSSYLFLLMLIIYLREESSGSDSFPGKVGDDVLKRILMADKALWLIPVFTIGMCLFYMRLGDYIVNITAAVLMTGLIWHAVSGLLSLKGQKSGKKLFYIVTLLFCLTEYSLWTASCFWIGDTLASPYFWFDFLLSLLFVLFIPALGKAVSR